MNGRCVKIYFIVENKTKTARLCQAWSNAGRRDSPELQGSAPMDTLLAGSRTEWEWKAQGHSPMGTRGEPQAGKSSSGQSQHRGQCR